MVAISEDKIDVVLHLTPGEVKLLRRDAKRLGMNFPEFARLALLLADKWDWDPFSGSRDGASRKTCKVTCKLTLGRDTRRELVNNYSPRGVTLDGFAVAVLQKIAAGGGLKFLLEELRKDKKGKEEGAAFTFCDLFAGIGGIRLAFESAGGRCVYSSEWDKFAKRTYCLNHLEWPNGDIYDRKPGDIQSHNILTGGFPCQPFSLAGVSKKNALGRKHGFEDKTQGTLFFEIQKILEEFTPEMFLLENVKNLKSHNGGDTFETIKKVIDRLGYQLFYKVIDAKDYLPQHRERIFLVGVNRKIKDSSGSVPEFSFPGKPDKPMRTLEQVLESDDSKVEKYRLTPRLWEYLQQYAKKHRAAGNGFGFSRFERGKDETVRTLSARYHKDGSEILVKMHDGKQPDTRRLTPVECKKLMGFPSDFRIRDVVSDTQAYRQFGNSVAVPVVEAIAEKMVEYYRENFCR